MTVQELMIELEGMPQDAEVRFASQPAWPFEYSIDGVVHSESTSEDPDPDWIPETQEVVYLVEGTQIGYLPEKAREEIGW